jgi:hypothetical protein
MRTPVRSLRSLHALAIAIEATAARDPYPRLTQLMQCRMDPVAEPYPRLAQVMQHLAIRRGDLRATA